MKNRLVVLVGRGYEGTLAVRFTVTSSIHIGSWPVLFINI